MIRLRRFALAFALLAAAPLGRAPAQAPTRHTITHEDVWLMKRVGAPAVSPDGRWVVFSVTEPAYADAETSSDLWIVATDGSAEPRRLTATRAGEGGAAWSPDSRRIAFSARREGDDASQIYVLDVAQGGEAQRVTNLSTGAGGPKWRPDGRAILFVSTIYPGAATDSANRAEAAARRARKWNARVFDGFPVRNWDRWLDERRPSLFVQPLEPGAQARDLLAGTRLAALPGFGGQLGDGGEGIDAAWTPDGGGVVFAATTNRNEAAFAEVTTSLWLVGAGGGEPQRLTTDADDYGSPQFRADARALYASWSPNNGRVYNNRRIVMWTWPGMGQRQVVAGGPEVSPQAWQPASDGRGGWFLAESAGLVGLYRAGTTGAAQPLREPGSGAFSGLDAGGTAAAPVLVAGWQSAVSPPEIVRIDPATGRTTPLTRFNVERAASIDWQPVRHFWFTSSRGARIHNMLVVPAAFDSTRRYPLFVVIHGGAANMWTDQFVIRWNYHLLGAPGYVVLLTDYTGSTGYGEAFAQAIQNDPLNGPGRDLLEGVDETLRRFPFVDSTRMVAGGASYGGHLANWLAVNTTRFKALVSHAGLWDLESQWGTSDVMYGREVAMGGLPWVNGERWRAQSPLQKAANLHTPVLVSVGERDFRVPMNNALEFWAALQRMRVPSRLIVWPEENHWIMRGEDSRYFYREVYAWIARWLGEGGAPAGRE
jgi:dipeptidyl aminopeptidase/acylaminoacyl peptidase